MRVGHLQIGSGKCLQFFAENYQNILNPPKITIQSLKTAKNRTQALIEAMHADRGFRGLINQGPGEDSRSLLFDKRSQRLQVNKDTLKSIFSPTDTLSQSSSTANAPGHTGFNKT
jgi:hypothetical protein